MKSEELRCRLRRRIPIRPASRDTISFHSSLFVLPLSRAAGLRALRVGVGPYGMRYVLIQLRTPYSELRIVKGVGPYDITVRSCIIPNSDPPSGTNPLRALRAHLPLLRGGYAASDQCAYPSRYAQFRTPNSEFRTVKGVGPYHALRKKRALTFVRALFCCVRGITPSWPWPGQPGS